MGKNQRAKQARREQSATGKQAPPASAKTGIWLALGLVALLLVVAVAALFFFIQSHPERFLKAGLASTVQLARQELGRERARFSLEEGEQLQRLLGEAAGMVQNQKLDRQSGSMLNFLLQATREIIREGNLNPGELGKLEALMQQTRKLLERSTPAHERAKP
jgi:hypothetical protein